MTIKVCLLLAALFVAQAARALGMLPNREREDAMALAARPDR